MNPIDSIKADRAQARRQGDTNADVCFLAIADPAGEASVRTLVLRDITENRFSLFINKSSPKWQALFAGGSWQLLLWYASMQRQYRVSGQFQEIPAEVIQQNWHRRPAGSKYLDHVYEELGAQSSPIDSRDTLLNKVAEIRQRKEELSVPPGAVGIELVAERIELLDLNKEDRIHDRRVFSLKAGTWQQTLLIP